MEQVHKHIPKRKWAGMLLITELLKIVLVKDKNGLWGIPGGMIKRLEKYIDAAKRETKEESYVWIGSRPVISFNKYDLKNLICVVFMAAVRKFGHKFVLDEDGDIVEANSFFIEEALKLNLKQKDRLILEDLHRQTIALPNYLAETRNEKLSCAHYVN